MGFWQLEVIRMALYVSFPVGTFYLVNQPQYFEKSINEIKEQYMEKLNLSPEQFKQNADTIEKFIEEYDRERMKREIQKMESQLEQ